MKLISRFSTILMILVSMLPCRSQTTEQTLTRYDKHFLGGGSIVIWAPEFPLFLDKLGFWDHACFLSYPVDPLFTVTLLDNNLKELPLRFLQRKWVPSHLTQIYEQTTGIEISEQKALLPDDILVSRITFKNLLDQQRQIHAIVWTCQSIEQTVYPEHPENKFILNHVFAIRSRISWQKELKNEVTIGAVLGAQNYARTFSVNVSDSKWNYPYWNLTPFYEKLTSGGLPSEFHYDPKIHKTGAVYIGLHYDISIAANDSTHLVIYCAINQSEQAAIEAFDRQSKSQNPIVISMKNWDDFFATVPQFHCSDPYIEKYYYYRWYGLRLNMIDTNSKFNLTYPCIFEGVNAGRFRHLISYSACAHIRETRWMHNDEFARGSLLNFVAHQKTDGSFYGCLGNSKSQTHSGFYHANWGDAVRQLYRIHPNFDFLNQVYTPLVNYAYYFQHQRDRENWNLYDVINQWETGQEFSSRYLFGNSEADQGASFQLKGVDATVYLYELQKNLGWMAKELRKDEASKFWYMTARKTKEAILRHMWDDTRHMFVDFDPQRRKKSPVKTAVGFYPFMTDIPGTEHLTAITEHLLNPNEFWTDYPVPSTSLDDYYANAYGEWRDKRLNSAWNGRSWLMSNSHLCDALSETALRLNPQLKSKAAELIKRCIQMLYLDGDLNRPSSYPYYNSLNGKAPYFRGTDDYMHSWIVDLIIKYVVGLQPMDGNKIIIDPLPFGLTSFSLDNAIVKGRIFKIVWQSQAPDPKDKGFFIYIDGRLIKKTDVLTKLEIKL